MADAADIQAEIDALDAQLAAGDFSRVSAPGGFSIDRRENLGALLKRRSILVEKLFAASGSGTLHSVTMRSAYDRDPSEL